MRRVAAILCVACVIAGSSCRRGPSEEAQAAQAQAALRARLGPRLYPLFASIARHPLRPALLGRTEFDMQVFRGAIERGASIGGDHLDQLTRLGGAQAEAWLRTPADKRVFVAGAVSDGPLVWQLAQTLKADGYESYIYDFCQGREAWTGCPPCPFVRSQTSTFCLSFASLMRDPIPHFEASRADGNAKPEPRHWPVGRKRLKR